MDALISGLENGFRFITNSVLTVCSKCSPYYSSHNGRYHCCYCFCGIVVVFGIFLYLLSAPPCVGANLVYGDGCPQKAVFCTILKATPTQLYTGNRY